MQSGAEPEDLLDFILELKNFYLGNTGEDLDAILEKYSENSGEFTQNWQVIE